MGGADGLQPGNKQQLIGHPLYEPLIQQAFRSGRAVVWPEWYGYYERHDNTNFLAPDEQPAAQRRRYLAWRRETI